METFTREQLARYNGLDGARSYIAYQGRVYDVTDSFLWQRGRHQVLHRAGQDLTEALAQAPHGEDLLERVPLVGHLAEDTRDDRSPDDPGARLEQMVAKLKERDHRLTPQRMAVLKILAESEGHPTVEQIHAQIRADFPTTSLATVYKTLALLKDMGEVLELGFGDAGSRYDGHRPGPHPHLICTGCGAICDLEIAALDQVSRQVMQETGYQIVNHRLDFFGICPNCQAKHTGNTT